MLAQKGFRGKMLEPRWVGRPLVCGGVISDMEAKHKLPLTDSLKALRADCVCVPMRVEGGSEGRC